MSLFAIEFRKLFFNMRSLIILAVFILICGVLGMAKGYSAIGSINNYNIYKDLAKPFEGKPVDLIQADKSKQAVDEVLNVIGDNSETINNEKQTNPVFHFNYDYMKFAETADSYLNGSSKDLPDKPTGINKMEAYLNKLEGEGKIDTFSYKEVSKHLEIEKSMGAPLFYNTVLWENFLNNVGGPINFILLLLPIGIIIAPIFSREAASGMNDIILSSCYGRSRIVTAKTFVSALVSFIWITAYFTVLFLTNFLRIGSFCGSSAPARSLLILSGVSYHMTILQYAFLTYAWLMFSGLAYSMVIMLISSTQRTQLSTFGITLAVALMPTVLGAISFFKTNLWMFTNLGFASDVQSNSILGLYKVYNIFGQPVSYPVIAAIVLAVLGVCSIFIVIKLQKHRAVA